MNVAVLTGDIVGSTKIEANHKGVLIERMQDMVEEFRCIAQDIRMETYRGDSFQIMVNNPVCAVKLAILFRAGLRVYTPETESTLWDARISVGLGSISYNSGDLKTSDGEAFINSGHGLDTIGKNRLLITTPWKDVNEELDVLTAFADNIISNWTVVQSKIVYKKILTQKLQKEIALEENQKPANICTILKSANASLIERYINRYEQLIKEKIRR